MSPFQTRLLATASSTFNDVGTPFEIRYGSGAAQGTLGRDVVLMAGFEVANQTFGKSFT